MGSFIVNINVRTDQRQAVERELRSLNPAAAWVTGAANGWITVYEEQASTQDDRRIRQLTERVSAGVHVPAIAFLVHDSDVLCYWLFDDGRLLDEFNSCPDYFDDSVTGDAAPGRPDVLLKYCRPGTELGDVERVLNDRSEVFADHQLTRLAELLGIDGLRAGVDFPDIGSEIDPAELDAVFVGSEKPGHGARAPWRGAATAVRLHDEGDEEEGEAAPPHTLAGPTANILKMMGLGGTPPPADPLVQQLVEAAAANDVAEINKLVTEGANIQGLAPLKLKAPEGSTPLMARVFSGGGFAPPVTPLMAALASKKIDAARRLIELGADVRTQHPLLGTPTHVAAGTGDSELLRLVLDAGGDPGATNLQGQTPLQALGQFRQMLAQFSKLGQFGAALGKNINLDVAKLLPAPQALDACEQLLRERGGK